LFWFALPDEEECRLQKEKCMHSANGETERRGGTTASCRDGGLKKSAQHLHSVQLMQHTTNSKCMDKKSTTTV
jgi:hypothetical protein